MLSRRALDSALDTFRRSIFRIQCSYTDPQTGSERTTAGTAFILAIYQECRMLILGTAGHVIYVPPEANPAWLLVESNDRAEIVRQFGFTVAPESPAGIVTRHKTYDVGLFFVKGIRPDGSPFTRADDKPLPVIHPDIAVTTGTHLGWAGFASEIEGLFQTPCLCYYEGVVSLTFDRPGGSYYIIDGHNAFGVSGGPVWHWSEERERFEVVAIVSAYKQSVAGLPGVVIAEPINHLTRYILSNAFDEIRIHQPLITDFGGWNPTLIRETS